MKRQLIMAAGVVILASMAAFACGDKFMGGGRAVTATDVLANGLPRTIMIYEPDGSAMSSSDLPDRLRAAGHDVVYAATADELRAALEKGNLDVIITDLAAAPDARETVIEASWLTPVLPVLERADRPHLTAARREYGQVLNVPVKRESRLLSIVERSVTGS